MANTLEIIVKATDNASKTLQSINKELAPIGLSVTKIGAAMMGMGVAMVAGLGMAVKSAEEERISIMRLDAQLKNLGISYDNVKESLEGVIKVTMLKTGVADDAQRDAISRLLLVTNDYNKALKLLPLTLDLAAAGEMDAGTAATYLGKAMLELENGAEKVSIRFGRTTLEFKNLDELMKRVGGTAERMVSPLTVMGNLFKDLTETIGAQLLPDVNNIVGGLNSFLNGLKNINPELLRLGTYATVSGAALLLLVGGLNSAIGIMSKLTITTLPALLAYMGSPLGLVTIALTAAGGIAILTTALNELNRQSVTLNPNLAATTDHITAIGNNMDFFSSKAIQTTEALIGIKESSEKAKQATAEYAEDVKKLTEGLYQQKTAMESNTQAFADMMAQIGYTGSKAEKFNITMFDVYDALAAQGMKAEELRELWDKWGMSIGSVEGILTELGFTAEQIRAILDKQKGSVDSLTRSLKEMGDAAEAAADAEARIAGTTGAEREARILAYQRTMAGQPGRPRAGAFGLIPEASTQGGTSVNVTVQGSVIAERDLAEVIRKQLYDIRRYNVSLEMT